MSRNLNEARAQLRRLDRDLAGLLARRSEVSTLIAAEKSRAGVPLRDLVREARGVPDSRSVDPVHVHTVASGLAAIVRESVRQQSRDLGLPEDLPVTPVSLGHGVEVGRGLVFIAGPCAVESDGALDRTAREVVSAGASALRGGCFKPRSSPYSFRGLGQKGMAMLKRCGARLGVPVVSEIVDPRQLDNEELLPDVVQIGSRNMHNYALLDAAGRCPRPILLKRGMAATLEEFVSAAEYLRAAGHEQILLCERGIRTFESATRFTLDVAAIPILKAWTGLPVVVDPSHAAGYREWVAPLALAAVAAGADALLVEVHHDPDRARCDGRQSLTPGQFVALVERCFALDRVLRDSLAYRP